MVIHVCCPLHWLSSIQPVIVYETCSSCPSCSTRQLLHFFKLPCPWTVYLGNSPCILESGCSFAHPRLCKMRNEDQISEFIRIYNQRQLTKPNKTNTQQYGSTVLVINQMPCKTLEAKIQAVNYVSPCYAPNHKLSFSLLHFDSFQWSMMLP